VVEYQQTKGDISPTTSRKGPSTKKGEKNIKKGVKGTNPNPYLQAEILTTPKEKKQGKQPKKGRSENSGKKTKKVEGHGTQNCNEGPR